MLTNARASKCSVSVWIKTAGSVVCPKDYNCGDPLFTKNYANKFPSPENHFKFIYELNTSKEILDSHISSCITHTLYQKFYNIFLTIINAKRTIGLLYY